ncbi:tyrosine-type recombinase/integrase [Novosphingobium rosa]|jgi:integrase|uniref:tyrosine-type recombinase/integrase n=1 Tax=Novosphingobium rosa TaxID=76978 RepID=UPI00082D1307|nr:integrase family protein [Novosphingobium rosa]
MANRKLTKTSVDAIEAPDGKDLFVWDTDLRGFGVRITPKGVKSFVLQFRMKNKAARRVTIGGFGTPWTVDGARKEAERRLLKIRQGIDPAEEERLKAKALEREAEARAEQEADKARQEILRGEREKEAQTLAFENYADSFVEIYLKSNWPDSWKTAEGILNAAKPYFKKSIKDVARADVVEHLDRYNDRPAMKKLVHSTFRKLLNWAEDRGVIDRSPIYRMKAPKAVAARRRILSAEEIIAAWLAAAEMGSLWRPYIRLLICTMARREEVAGMDGAEVDLAKAIWELPPERAKNGQPHRIPLNELALIELRSLGIAKRGLVFTTTGKTSISGFSKMKKALDEKMVAILKVRAARRGEDCATVVLPPWRLHDLRRTGTTNLQALGVPVEVTEAILNHISGTTAGVAGVYNLYRYDPEKRLALEKWSKQLALLIRSGRASSKRVERQRRRPA